MRTRPNGLAHRFELARVGALETVDRLLEVADHEQCPPAGVRRPRPAEIFPRERIDDRPLVGVGILRFIDKDMVGPAVELVAHPFAHPRRIEQAAGPADEIVEIGHSGGALGAGIGFGEGGSGAQSRGLNRGERGTTLERQERADRDQQALGMGFIVRVGLDLTGRDFARFAFLREDDLAKAGQRSRAFRGRKAEPLVDRRSVADPGFCAPIAVGRGDCPQQIAVEPIFGAMARKQLLDRARRNAHDFAKTILDQVARAERRDGVSGAGAVHQIGFGILFPQAQAKRLCVGGQPDIAA